MTISITTPVANQVLDNNKIDISFTVSESSDGTINVKLNDSIIYTESYASADGEKTYNLTYFGSWGVQYTLSIEFVDSNGSISDSFSIQFTTPEAKTVSRTLYDYSGAIINVENAEVEFTPSQYVNPLIFYFRYTNDNYVKIVLTGEKINIYQFSNGSENLLNSQSLTYDCISKISIGVYSNTVYVFDKDDNLVLSVNIPDLIQTPGKIIINYTFNKKYTDVISSINVYEVLSFD